MFTRLDPNCLAEVVCIPSVLQQLGFVMVSVLYFVMAGKFNWLSESSHIGVFEFLYFFSSFWGQFGPNCTTFLLAGATTPTSSLRSADFDLPSKALPSILRVQVYVGRP